MPFGETIHPFFSGDRNHGNVVFNFTGDFIGDMARYAEGYHSAGRRLVETMSRERGYYDFDGYPVFFLYRHSLELYLKAILLRGAKYVGLTAPHEIDTSKVFRDHKLGSLLPAVREVLDRVGWSGDLDLPGIRTWSDFTGLIRAIDGVDPGSDAFRYPVTTRGSETLPRHLVLNAAAFGQNLDPLLERLDAIEGALEDRWQYAEEALAYLNALVAEWRTEGDGRQ